MTTCELCGRALSVAAGEPVVCSDCAAELRELREMAVRFTSRFVLVTHHLMTPGASEPGSSSPGGGRR